MKDHATPLRSGAEGFLYKVAALTSIILSLLIIWYAFEGTFVERRVFANVVLGACFLIYYFEKAHEELVVRGPESSTEYARGGLMILGGVSGILAGVYVHLSYERWLEQAVIHQYTTMDLVVGAIISILVIDMTFRSFGRALGLAVVAALAYGWIGNRLPGFLYHSGLTLPDLIARQTIQLEGVYGSLLQIAATWVAIFLLFAGFVEAHGGFEYIKRMGRRVALHFRSGVAQSSVVASMFVGMLTGGAAVNVALSGSFTIPLMKDNGIPPRVAGAIESMASSGGQILPPVMGLAAFLIADFIGVSYAEVIIAALIPALLFYGTVAIAVHVLITSSGWTPEITIEEVRDEKTTEGVGLVLETLQYLLPLVVLLYTLISLRWPVMLAGGWTIGTFLLLRLVFMISPYSEEHVTVDLIMDFVRDSVEGLRIGSAKLAPFVGLLGALGMLVTTLSFSGLGLQISTIVVMAGGGSFIVILLLTMLVSILFGLGMPTPAAYVLVATVLAPSLITIGLGEMTAHLFVFYFALLSSITPPVAVACAVACEIAEADFLETVKSTLIIGGPVYVIPFVFVANPSILEWTYPAVYINLLLISIGMIGLIIALTGSNGNRSFSLVERGLLIGVFPLIAFYPELLIRVLGAIAIATIALRGSNIVKSVMNETTTLR